jgi:excisionase family DNA binding protein
MEMLKGAHVASAVSVWLTASEAAQYLRVEPRTLLMWARQGKVKGYVLSGTTRVTWRFRAEDLDATMSPPSVAHKNGRIQ